MACHDCKGVWTNRMDAWKPKDVAIMFMYSRGFVMATAIRSL